VKRLVSFAPLLMDSVHEGYRHSNVSGGVYLRRVLGAHLLSQEPTIYRGEGVLVYSDQGRVPVVLAVWVVEVEVAEVVVAVLSAREALDRCVSRLFESLA
jgi:hypothetical protein